MDKVFCVIVNYNSQQWIARTIQSVIHSNYALKVVIVDNDSTDGSLEWLQQNYPQLIYHKTQTNLGFGKANNIGISLALEHGADYVFLQNQDVYLHPDSIKTLVQAAKVSSKYAILSPMHYNGNGNALDYWFSTYMSPPLCHGLVSDITVNQPLKLVYPTKMVNAAAWLISKKHLQLVGGFHPAFFHYGEDSNYCQRVLFLGFKIGIVPRAKIYHDRDNRPANKFETNDVLIYERYLNKVASFPNSLNHKFYLATRLSFEIVIHLFTFKYKKIKLGLAKLLVLYKFNNSEVRKYNRKFKMNNFSYLNEN